MVGYIRGFKNRSVPFFDVTKKLILRALVLYGWFVAATIFYSVFQWYTPDRGLTPWVPYDSQSASELIYDTISLAYAHVWIHFLYLYAIFLALSPIAIWLLRRSKAALLILLSFMTYLFGFISGMEWMQWQLLFFLPAVAGFYLETIMAWWQALDRRTRSALRWTCIATLATTALASAYYTFVEPSTLINAIFSKEPMTVARVLLGFIWFAGLFFIFQLAKPLLVRYVGWLLEPFGTRSLTAYIVHGLVIGLLALFIAPTDSIVANTLIGIASIMLTWLLIRLPVVQRIVPR